MPRENIGASPTLVWRMHRGETLWAANQLGANWILQKAVTAPANRCAVLLHDGNWLLCWLGRAVRKEDLS